MNIMSNKERTSYGLLFISCIKLAHYLKRKMEGMGDKVAEKLEEEKEACFSEHICRKVHDYRKIQKRAYIQSSSV